MAPANPEDLAGTRLASNAHRNPFLDPDEEISPLDSTSGQSMETVNSGGLHKTRTASNSHRNNPFLPNGRPDENISPTDSTNPVIQEDSRAPFRTSDPDDETQFKNPRPSRSKPGLLSTLLNFGLNTTPDRSEEGGSGASVGARSFPIPIPLPSIPVPIVSMKARRPSAIIRNVTGFYLFHKPCLLQLMFQNQRLRTAASSSSNLPKLS
jgi:hypothetical protein